MRTYSEKLRDPRWQKKRLQILERDDFTCQACKTTEIELHIHHIEYSPGDPWEIDDESLITLCKDCHQLTEAHGGGQPAEFIAWDQKRENAIVYEVNYICSTTKDRDMPFSMLNERYLRMAIENMPEGWLDRARDHSEWLRRRMEEREKEL